MQPVVYDYSRPLDLTSPAPAQPVVDQAVASLDSARAAFQAGDYAQALKLADQAIQQTPNDPMLHEFRAMCLFAMGRYDEAAVPLYTVLSTGPGWDWTTLAGLYPNIDVYTQQLRALEAYCNANPQAASARFLLAALYMTQGSNDAAAGILKQVVALQPQDKLSAQLLAALTVEPRRPNRPRPSRRRPRSRRPPRPRLAAQPASEPAAPSPAAGAEAGARRGPALPTGPVPAKLVGTWTASPAKDVTISLALDPGKGFTWKVTDRGQSRQFQGQATFDNDVLALVAARSAADGRHGDLEGRRPLPVQGPRCAAERPGADVRQVRKPSGVSSPRASLRLQKVGSRDPLWATAADNGSGRVSDARSSLSPPSEPDPTAWLPTVGKVMFGRVPAGCSHRLGRWRGSGRTGMLSGANLGQLSIFAMTT